MQKIHYAMLTALCAGVVATSLHAAPEQPASTSAAQADCPPLMNQSAAERIEPPGPVGRSGGATAMVDGSGTLGSTGATRATTTSGATGTTGETGGYGTDSSGSVTASGSTGAPPSTAIECAPGSSGSSSGGAPSTQGSDALGRTPADVSPEQAEPRR